MHHSDNAELKTNNTQIENAEDIHVVIHMHSLIEYSDNCPKISWSLWQYLTNFESFKFKAKVTGNTPSYGNTKNVEIVVPSKWLINF